MQTNEDVMKDGSKEGVESTASAPRKRTEAELQRIEANRQKALDLYNARVVANDQWEFSVLYINAHF